MRCTARVGCRKKPRRSDSVGIGTESERGRSSRPADVYSLFALYDTSVASHVRKRDGTSVHAREGKRTREEIRKK